MLWGIYPTVVTLGAARFLAGEPLSARRIAGGLVAALGLIVVFWAKLSADAPLPSLAAVLLAILCSAAGTMLFKRFAHDVGPIALNAIATGASAIALLPLVLVARVPVLPPDESALLALAYLIVIGGSAFLLWAWLLQRWPATRVSYQTVLSPLVAVLLGAVVLSEGVEPLFLGGGALVLLGTWVAITAHAEPA
ncbi:MAG: DMT family transporter [Halobacteriales archaeon]|nr:DMT family transporter [Halobacteriales archaeon]